MSDGRQHDRFHGRVRGVRQPCAHAGCAERGEFRAPGTYANAADGPSAYRYMCLDHIREFNTRYNFFNGMSREEIEDAQIPLAGWGTETRAFSSVDRPPKWSDFHDPLDAISARFRTQMPKERVDGKQLTSEDRRALKILGLSEDADRKALRSRYSELVRRFHPDRNGGDRTQEKALQSVVDAYQLLRASSAFAT
jgi:DnaJ domain